MFNYFPWRGSVASRNYIANQAIRALALIGSYALCTNVFAAEISEPKPHPTWYLTGSIGQQSADIDHARINSRLQQDSGVSVRSITDDHQATSYKLGAGYALMQNLGLEVGYVDLGKQNFTATTKPDGSLTGQRSVQALNFDVIGNYAFKPALHGFARLGLSYAKVNDSFTREGAVLRVSDGGTSNAVNLHAGLGVQYEFSPAWAVRLEAERYLAKNVAESTQPINLISLGLVWRFGVQ
ncbi:outer membrane beta-barrel protein [Undibacterium rugosum]|uniref:outer membrane beta-barrel protein n=1 Tax=Undibacterium rugosum TaxID=2762291 RepID=UPI001B822418|nr:outer membrane beta-barrel protein [Undibacterium rugosum]MBR7780228.1 outer membrane beta-barrel protein [Undibacterium rugosum]